MLVPWSCNKPLCTAEGLSSLLGLALLVPAHAAPPPISIPATEGENAPPPATGFFGFLEGIDRSTALLGDLWGLRRAAEPVRHLPRNPGDQRDAWAT